MSEAGAVLVVDDEESFLLSTAALLRRDGYICDTARDGMEAVSLLGRQQYNAMIADIRMAGNTELELVRNVRHTAPGMPVILVTGYPSVETAVESVGLPVTAYLTKPLDYTELREQLVLAIERSHGRRLLSSIRDHLQECVGDVDDMCHGVGQIKEDPAEVSLVLVRTLASCLAGLLRLRATNDPAKDRPKLCELIDCPDYPTHRRAIVETIEILKQTKSSFKSKDLAELRVKLEQLLGTEQGT